MSLYTLVRHSAYAVGANADFEDAVEPCELTERQDYHVRAAGGLLFASHEAAQAAADACNYPPGTVPGRPNAPGYFSNFRIGGAELYVPRPVQADASAAPPVRPTA
jgi:hypothetical protein